MSLNPTQRQLGINSDLNLTPRTLSTSVTQTTPPLRPAIPADPSPPLNPSANPTDARKTHHYAQSSFDVVHFVPDDLAESAQTSQTGLQGLPPQAELDTALNQYQILVNQYADLPESQITPQIRAELDQGEAKLASLINRFTEVLESHSGSESDIQPELQRLGEILRQAAPARSKAQEMREALQLRELMALPDTRANRQQGALTTAMPAIEAGLKSPNQDAVPKGLDQKYYHLGRAMAKNQISLAELRHFSLTGEMSDKLKAALNRAQEEGSWTALNATQGMLDTRMAVLRIQTEKLRAELNGLRSQRTALVEPVDPAEQTRLDQELSQLEPVIAELDQQLEGLKKLKTKTINNASRRRIDQGERQLQSAQWLEQQATRSETRQPERAKSLRAQAARVRESGIKVLQTEGQNLQQSVQRLEGTGKEVPNWLRRQASDAYDGAATGYLHQGQSEISALPATATQIELPAALQRGVGADQALQQAEFVNPAIKDDLDHQGLRSQYHDQRRTVFNKQATALGYDKALAAGAKPSQAAIDARKAYFGESHDLLGSVEKRISLLQAKDPRSLNQHQQLGQLQHSAGSINREFAQTANHQNQAQLILQQSRDQLPQLQQEAISLDAEIKSLKIQLQMADQNPMLATAKPKLQEQLNQKQTRLDELQGESSRTGLLARTEQTLKAATAAAETYTAERKAANQGTTANGHNDLLTHLTEADRQFDAAAQSYTQALQTPQKANTPEAQAQYQSLQREAGAFYLDQAQHHAEAQDMLSSQGQLYAQTKQEKTEWHNKQAFFKTLPTGVNTLSEQVGSLKSEQAKLKAEISSLEEVLRYDASEHPNLGVFSQIEDLTKKVETLQTQIGKLEQMPLDYQRTSRTEIEAKITELGAPDALLATLDARPAKLAGPGGVLNRTERAADAFAAVNQARALSLQTPEPQTDQQRAEQLAFQTQQVLTIGTVAGTFATDQAEPSLKLLEAGQNLVQNDIRPALNAEIARLEAASAKSSDPGARRELQAQIAALKPHADQLSFSLAGAITRTIGELYGGLRGAVAEGRYDGADVDKAFKTLKSVTSDITDPELAEPHQQEINRVNRQFTAMLLMTDTAKAQLIAGNQAFNANMDQIYQSIKASNDAAISDIIDLGSKLIFWGDSLEDQMNAEIKGQLDSQITADGRQLRHFQRGEQVFRQGLGEAMREGRSFEFLGLTLAGQDGRGSQQSQIEQRLNQDFLAGVQLPRSPEVKIGGQTYSYDKLDDVAKYTPADLMLGGHDLRGIFNLHPGLQAFSRAKAFNAEGINSAIGPKDQAVISSGAETALDVYGKFAVDWGKEAQKYAIVNTVLETALFCVVPIPLGSAGTAANGLRATKAMQALARVPGLARAVNGASQLGRAVGESRQIIRLAEGMAALQKARPVLYSFGRGVVQMGALSGSSMLAEKWATQAYGVDSAITKLVRVGGNMLDIGAASRISRLKDLAPKLVMAEGMAAVNLFAVPAVVKDPEKAALVSWMIGAVVPAAMGAHSLKNQAHAQASEITRQLGGEAPLQHALEREMAHFGDQNAQAPASAAQFKAHSERLNILLTENGVAPEQASAAIAFQQTQWAHQRALHQTQTPTFDAQKLPTEVDATRLVDATARQLIETGLPPQEAFQRAGDYVSRSFDARAQELRRDGKTESDVALATAFEHSQRQARSHGEAGHWAFALNDLPENLRPQVQQALSESRAIQVNDSKAHLDQLRSRLAVINTEGQKVPAAELNTLMLLESQRLVMEGTQTRVAAFEAEGLALTPHGIERMMQVEAEKLGLNAADAQQFVQAMTGEPSRLNQNHQAQASEAGQLLDQADAMGRDVAPIYRNQLEHPELVKRSIEEAYQQGLELAPQAFGPGFMGGGLKADPRHQQFSERLPELMAAQDAPVLTGSVGEKTGWNGKSSETSKVDSAEGTFYFKPLSLKNADKPRREVLASLTNDLMGLDIIPETRFRSFDGVKGSAQAAVPDGFVQGQHIPRRSLTSDPLYRDALSELRTLDYLIAAGDRHPGNLFIDSQQGRIMAIDSEGALGQVIPFSEPNRTDSGGVLPEHYTPRMREAVARLTPEALQNQFKGLASAAELDAMLLRVNIVKADMLAKQGPDALLDKPSAATDSQPLNQSPAVSRLPAGTSTSERERGPDPLMLRPPAEAVLSARQALVDGKSISSEQVQLILTDTAVASREALKSNRPKQTEAEFFSPEGIKDWCGYGQATVYYRLRELGIPDNKIHLHQALETFGANKHAFLTVDMPDGKSYLIDTTFRQFFDPNSIGPNHAGEAGRVMRQSPEGRQIADQILYHGFVELNDKVASRYGQAMREGASGPTITAQTLSRTTGQLDFERYEVEKALPPPPPLDMSDALLQGGVR